MTISIATAAVTITDRLTKTTYSHDFVTNITIVEGRTNNMTVSPQGGGEGIVYDANLTVPVMTDMIVRGTQIELAQFYKAAYDKKLRFDVMIVDTATNERYDINRAIIRDSPRSTTITEGEASLDQALGFASPPAFFTHAPA